MSHQIRVLRIMRSSSSTAIFTVPRPSLCWPAVSAISDSPADTVHAADYLAHGAAGVSHQSAAGLSLLN